MRFLRLLLALILGIAWIWLLHHSHGALPAMGKLLDPVSGFWANAEPVTDVPAQFHFPDDKVNRNIKISFDNRLVPHIKAGNDEDLYRAQGYLHAWYRLWQMDMQTRAAAGRISEIVGEKTFEFDRGQRRKGMLWAAENSLKAMEADSTTKKILDSYTKGVNLFIRNLKYKDYPLEYKLMGFDPEPWTNLKCALLLKYMADDLTGSVDDIAMSYLHDALSAAELNDLFPESIDGSQPVIPAGTTFTSASKPVPPVPSGYIFAHFDTVKIKDKAPAKKTAALFKEASGIGSNNWAVGGARTDNGAAILCNDPHLGLNLPSIWYELQLSAPGMNCYGASIPGAPGIIIGFNDSISWGFTNNYRDVKDYYEIRSEDPRLYFFDGREIPFNKRHEAIYVKDKKDPFVDTIRFTIHGPVQYDASFPEPSGSGKILAMTWMAHRGTNELLSVYQYNHARNYDEFVQGIRHFECPAQNFVFADRKGNIAMWGQGRFINKWKDQGKYVMRGDISATLWGDTIPMMENPHAYNPPQDYVASANQLVTDHTYPYWYNGDFTEFRSWELHSLLANLDTLTDVPAMQQIQNSTWSYLADQVKFIFSGANPESLPPSWNGQLSYNEKTAAVFQIAWYNLYKDIWQDEFRNFPDKCYPSAERTMQLIVQDSASRYYDDVTTPQREGLKDMVTLSLKQTMDSLKVLKKSAGTEWYQVKNTSVTHLAKIKAFSYDQLQTGGWGNTINAMKQNHGPSWRMIVRMNPDRIKAYVVYPGGQSGNPGSPYYANFLDYWVKGKYYETGLK